MIVGIGCDLVCLERIRQKYSEKLANKVLTKLELVEYNDVKDKARYLAKCWAVKEAAFKALNDSSLNMLDSVSYVSPNVYVKGHDDKNVFASVSDDNGFVMATVVAEMKGSEI